MEVESSTVIDPNVWEGWGNSSLLREEISKRRERLAHLGRMARYEYQCGRCYTYVWFDADDSGLEYNAGTRDTHPCYAVQPVFVQQPVVQQPAPVQQPTVEPNKYWWKETTWNTQEQEKN